MNLNLPTNRAIMNAERRWLAVPNKFKDRCNLAMYSRASEMRANGSLLKEVAFALKISLWTATRWCKGVRKVR
jgi:hypothetical protein